MFLIQKYWKSLKTRLKHDDVDAFKSHQGHILLATLAKNRVKQNSDIHKENFLYENGRWPL